MRNERGFTLIEILVSMAIFAMIVIGAMGVLGATDQGGFLEGFPTGFVTARVAKDYTAASVYLQSFNEFIAGKGSANATPGKYCIGSACGTPLSAISCPTPGTANPLPSSLILHPVPPGQTYQLNWSRLDVVIELWYWQPASNSYSNVSNANETLTRVCSTLTWQLRGTTRTLTVERFIP